MTYYTYIKNENDEPCCYEVEEIMSFTLSENTVIINKLIDNTSREIRWSVVVINKIPHKYSRKFFIKYEDARECFDEQIRFFKSVETQKKMGRTKFQLKI